MKVYNKAEEVTSEIKKLKKKNISVGFVPTMGALHKGHLSLVEKAGDVCDVVVVSIFVNPTQFNNPDDLKRYPRTLEKDLDLLEETPAKIVFAPTVKEIYPDENAKKSTYDFGNIGKVMEGKHRPGHFDGVAMVVKRLFEVVQPNKAFFGQKDIQQYLIIRHLNDNYLKDLNIEVIKCPIIREDDGLAMSSRNVLLSNQQRESAALISQTLFEAKSNYLNFSVDEFITWAIKKINSDKNLEVEYFEVVKDPDLSKVYRWDEADKVLVCVAVNAGNVRLIDNIYLK